MLIQLSGDKAKEFTEIKTPVIVDVIKKHIEGRLVVEIEIKDFTVRRKT